MFFRLKAVVVFSKPVQADFAQIVREADKLFCKGLKETDTRVANFKHEKERLAVEISGSRLPRPHAALFMLKKHLAGVLGKQKAGVRSLHAEEYTVEFDTAQQAKKPVRVPLADCVLEGRKCRLVFRQLDEEGLQENYVDRTIRLVDDKIKQQYYAGKEEYKEKLWESKEKKAFYSKEPSRELEERHWIRRAPGKAHWVYGPEFTALMNVLKQLMIKHVYEPLAFVEMTVPKIEEWEVPSKSGHAANIYPNAYFVCVPKQANPEYWEEVMDWYKITGKVPVDKIMPKIENIGMLSYAQCPPFWPFLQNSVIDEAGLPLKIYDWSGPTYRNEAGGTHGLDRVEEFHRVETLWVGTKKQVVQTWQAVDAALRRLFDKILELEIRVSKVTPWWMQHAGITTEKSTIEIGTLDYDAYLPYRGERSTEWLEIQNISSNGTKYTKAFNVKLRREDAWSGCGGNSLERWITALLAQKSPEPKNWPPEVRDAFQAKIKNIKPLKFY